MENNTEDKTDLFVFCFDYTKLWATQVMFLIDAVP